MAHSCIKICKHYCNPKFSIVSQELSNIILQANDLRSDENAKRCVFEAYEVEVDGYVAEGYRDILKTPYEVMVGSVHKRNGPLGERRDKVHYVVNYSVKRIV